MPRRQVDNFDYGFLIAPIKLDELSRCATGKIQINLRRSQVAMRELRFARIYRNVKPAGTLISPSVSHANEI